MDVDKDTSPSYFNPENLSVREQYRRYGKRQSDSSLSPYLDNSSPRLSEGRRSNTALFLEDIKHEADKFDYQECTPSRSHSAYKRGSSDGHNLSGSYPGTDLTHRVASYSLKACKIEEDATLDVGETTFALFASRLDSALQDEMSFPDLILQFEKTCRDVSESIRYGSEERHRIVEDRLTRQKAQFLLDEAGIEEIPEDLNLLPTTSHLEACQFVAKDITAQSCLRIVQWLEGLASKALDLENKVRGSHVGTYIPSSGIWHNTQRLLRRGSRHHDTVSHLDFDAPTRENAFPLPDDRKSDETLLEDIWTLICAGRLEEARDLCRSAGQAWRAATLSPFGGLNYVPSIEALKKNGRNRILQATELESGIGRQWRLWKWASYCASERIAELEGSKYETAVYAVQCSNLKRVLPICRDWESACWAICKSWLDIQVDMEVTQTQPGRTDDWSPMIGDSSSQQTGGSESWPLQVLNQQPRDISSLLQKLHSSEIVNEAVVRGCKEPHRQIEMNLMLGHIHHLLDLIWSWISPLDDDPSEFRPHGDPQMIRFGAHLVLVLRYMCGDHVKDEFKEKMMNIGDLIIQMYTMFLFTKQREELVGLYASKLARHRCIDIFVHMMELRLNASLHVKYKLFLSAMEYLPFSPLDDDPRGSFAEILERVLLRSREYKINKYESSSDVAEQHRLQSLEKAMVVQWFCFTPPSTVADAHTVSDQLLLLALAHCNILFREFALISMWRVPSLPIGAHKLLSFLAECLKQRPADIQCLEDHDASDYFREFKDWREYYSCDATYRNWLKLDLENEEVSPQDLSPEEKQRCSTCAKEMLSSSLSLLQRKEDPWMIPAQDHINETIEYAFIELHATAMLCLPSGEGMTPDATVCATLMSALYSSVSEDDVQDRQLTVNVRVSSKDPNCIEVVLRCLAVESDGPHDGGILAAMMAAGFKGELARFQAGVTMEISQIDGWYSSADGTLEEPATYIVRGLCRRCCLPELLLRCLQVSMSLVELGEPPECHNDLLELVASPQTGLLPLFSNQQLQEFLMFEREYSIREMELLEQAQF